MTVHGDTDHSLTLLLVLLLLLLLLTLFALYARYPPRSDLPGQYARSTSKIILNIKKAELLYYSTILWPYRAIHNHTMYASLLFAVSCYPACGQDCGQKGQMVPQNLLNLAINKQEKKMCDFLLLCCCPTPNFPWKLFCSPSQHCNPTLRFHTVAWCILAYLAHLLPPLPPRGATLYSLYSLYSLC